MDEEIAGKGQLSYGGVCWRGHVDVVDLGPCKSSTSEVWERAIKEAGAGRLVVYTDGSRDSGGQVGGGWHAPENGQAASRLVTSLLSGMGRWLAYARHSEWPRRSPCWCCRTQRRHCRLS